MNLVIDIGNTLLKYAVFDEKKIINQNIIAVPEKLSAKEIFFENKKITKAILSSVRAVPPDFISDLKSLCGLHILGVDTKLPFKNLYKTPETLGNDRIAGLAAAYALYPGADVLIIDAGTCITIDFLNARGEYHGGTISPGLNMKLKALHTFTGKLPLVNLRSVRNDYGFDTETSILAGAVNGSIAEIKTSIERYKEKYPELIAVLCGGDALFLAEKLKSSIFAVPELILIGLNELLEYNEC